MSVIIVGYGSQGRHGPGFGYHPKPVKTILIGLKDESLIPKTLEIFGDTGIKITCDGDRHLGTVIESEEFKDESEEVLAEEISSVADIVWSCSCKGKSGYTRVIRRVKLSDSWAHDE